MVRKQARKAVVISAVQFTGENISEILDFANNEKSVGYDTVKNQYYIKTLEGNHYITNGDYIIRGVEGEYYPCKERIFEKTYTEVE